MMKGDGKYAIRENMYFDWAAGVRATDRYHKCAKLMNEEIMRFERDGRHRKLARLVIEMSEAVREKIAKRIHCDPKNVSLSSSATAAAFPHILALLEKNKKNGLIITHQGNDLYPTLSDIDFWQDLIKGKHRDKNLTRQNYGINSCESALLIGNSIAQMCKRNSIVLTRINPKNLSSINEKDRRIFGGIRLSDMALIFIYSTADFPLEKTTGEPIISIGKAEAKNAAFIDVYEHCHRTTGEINEDALGAKIGYDSTRIKLVDCSHTFSSIDFDAPLLGDICIMSSSKTLGAEPTIGISYVSDEVLGTTQKFLPLTSHPQILGEFSNKTALAPNNSHRIWKPKYRVSLPELYSLYKALEDLESISIDRRNEVLLEMRNRIINGVMEPILTHIEKRNRRSLDACSKAAIRLNNGIEFYIKPISTTDNVKLYFQKLLLNPNRYLSGYLALPSPLPKNFFIRFNKTEYHVTDIKNLDWCDEIARAYDMFDNSLGLSVPPELRDTWEYNESIGMPVSLDIRISFRHDVNQDVEGLIAAINKILITCEKVVGLKTAAIECLQAKKHRLGH